MKKIHDVSISIQQLLKNRRFSETKDVIRVFDCRLQEETFNELNKLNGLTLQLSDFGLSVLSEIGDEIDFSKSLDDYKDHIVTVKVEKPSNENLYFFTPKGFDDYLTEHSALTSISFINLSFIKETFKTFSLIFIPIGFDIYEPQNFDCISVIKYVKPLTTEAQKYLVLDLSKWLCLEGYYENCHETWMNVSSKKIMSCLGSEFSIVGEKIILEIVGDRRKKIEFNLDLGISKELFKILNDIGSWIFTQAKDTDSRHTIFNYELGKLIPDQLEITSSNYNVDIFKNAFESSKLVYRYHLIASSKELNKTLVELNKSLFEYVAKIRQNTVDLINTMWRDFATSFGVIILNYTLKREDLKSNYFIYFGILLCIYLLFSFVLSSKISLWFYRNLKKGLSVWRPRIYGYMSDSDFNDFALQPLRKAQNRYMFTFWVVLILYLLMILSVIQFIFKIKIVDV